MTKIKVIDFNGEETIYDVPVEHGVTSIGYYLIQEDGMRVIIHPETVKRIEIYEGETLCEKIEQISHKCSGIRSKEDFKTDTERHFWLAYTILRRLINKKRGRHKDLAHRDLEHVRRVCFELEGKSMEELEIIHKREIGY